jgi:hypothetical protein
MALPLGTKPPEVALRLTDGAAALAGGVVALGGKVGMTTDGLGLELPPTLPPPNGNWIFWSDRSRSATSNSRQVRKE